MSWLPLTWAVFVLVMQFDLWWESYSLSSLEAWSVGAFVLLLVVAPTLFAAGGLVLPSSTDDYPPDLERYFHEHGRWGVGMVGFVLAVVALRTSRPKLCAAATVLFGAYLAAYLWMFVPRTY